MVDEKMVTDEIRRMVLHKETNPDQIYALTLRIARFLRDKMSDLDGNVVQDAIRLREVAFWEKLNDAMYTLKRPWGFIELAQAFPLLVDDSILPRSQIPYLGKGWGLTETAKEIIENEPCVGVLGRREVDIVYLLPTREVPLEWVLYEFHRRNLAPAEPVDAIQLTRFHNDKMLEGNSGLYIHKVIFINKRNHSKSLELGVGAMGDAWIRPASKSRPSCCYAARRFK